MNKDLPQRKRLRCEKFDYSAPGAYFITFCTHHKQNTLSHVGAIHESPETTLTPYGKIAEKVIEALPIHLKATVDHYVIMPNHIHLIVSIDDCDELRAIRESPLRGRSIISKVIGYIKMNTSKEIHRRYSDSTIWQRGFYDHVIRDRNEYEKLATYIYENPLRWQHDCLYTT